MRHIGQLIQQRREAMGLSQAALSREMDGYPSASLMSRIESGEVELTAKSAIKYADALRLPKDAVLNAAGIATADQTQAGLEALVRMVGEDVPVMLALPVVDRDHPDLMLPVARRMRELKKPEDLFLVDLVDRADKPYVGEVMASRERKPKEGQGVVAEVSGRLGAWTYHSSRSIGEWLENGAGEKVTKFRLWGVILRYVTAFELE